MNKKIIGIVIGLLVVVAITSPSKPNMAKLRVMEVLTLRTIVLAHLCAIGARGAPSHNSRRIIQRSPFRGPLFLWRRFALPWPLSSK